MGSFGRGIGVLVAFVAALSLTVVFAATAAGDGDPQPVDFAHNVTNAPAPVAGAVFGNGPAVKTGSAICTTPTQPTPNVNTDCETSSAGPGPHNETSIAINPTDQNNLIGGANDYQLGINPGGHVSESVLSRAHVSFDRGRTWSMYPVFSNSAYQATGDPAVAFDDSGNAYYGTLGFRFVGPTSAQNPDVLVSTSSDKGQTWTVHRIAQGSGNEGSVGDLLDKEYVTAWGNGNAIVTYGDFRLGHKGSFDSAVIFSSITHDAGRTWSAPQPISGPDNEAFVSIPVHTNDGRVFVAYLNTVDNTTGRDDYRVVEVSPATGARIAGPFTVSHVIDGVDDYPFALGSPTYHDSIFRTWAAGNITSDPTQPGHLAVVWSDMRDGPATDQDPYKTETNSDVIVSQSFDYGRTWSPVAVPIARDGDQWMPWGAYDKNGLLRIGTFDRSGDALNHTYNYSLATETAHASLAFTVSPVTDVRSDPTRDDRWFAATLNDAFPFATSFIGDYSNIAVFKDGTVASYWTDLRNPVSFGGRSGHGEDAYFAHTP